MDNKVISAEQIEGFRRNLVEEEKSGVTVEKYMRDVKRFLIYAGGRRVDKELTINYKKELIEKGYAVSSINSMLASLNSLLMFLGWEDCKVKSIKTQRQIYCAEEKELSKAEYLRLLEASKGQPRLYLILQTICGTGIRISELSYFTVESVEQGEISVSCKTFENSAKLQKNLMKLTYAGMEYEIGEETIEDNKATVRVIVRNANYMELMDEALFETLKEGKDDAYTEEVFQKLLQEAEKQEEVVLVNYRLKDEQWVFDGSNSLLQAAMLGYLKSPDEMTE